jgi:hypothetical protein
VLAVLTSALLVIVIRFVYSQISGLAKEIGDDFGSTV